MRILRITAGASVQLILLRFENGLCSGAGCNGGAIANSGALSVTFGVFVNNSSTSGYGGAIYNDYASSLFTVEDEARMRHVD